MKLSKLSLLLIADTVSAAAVADNTAITANNDADAVKCASSGHVPCKASDSKWYCLAKGTSAGTNVSGVSGVTNSAVCSSQVEGGAFISGDNTCSGDLKSCTLTGTSPPSICVSKFYTNATGKDQTVQLMGVSSTSNFKSPNNNGGCFGLADNAEIANVGDSCQTVGHVPCKASNSKFYCLAKGTNASTNVSGVSGVTNSAVCTAQAEEGVIIGSDNSCASGMKKCGLSDGSNSINVCVNPSTSAATTKGTGVPKIMNLTQSTYKTPNVTGGCFGIADNTEAKAVGDRCITIGHVPCKASDNKYYCLAKATSPSTAVSGVSGVTNSAVCSSQAESGTIVGSDNTCAAGLKKCGLTDGTTTINVCVNPSDSKATTKNTGVPNIFGQTQSTFKTPNVNSGCFGLADNAEVKNVGEKCSSSGHVPCKASDNKYYCLGKATSPSTAVSGVSGVTNSAVCSSQVASGEIIGSDNTCATGLKKCGLTDGTSTINICADPLDSKATAKKGYPNINGLTNTTFYAPDVEGGCFGIANNAEVKNVGERCSTTGHVPCKASNNKFYCLAKATSPSTAVSGVSGVTNSAVCSSQAQGGTIIGSDNTCATGLKKCSLKPSSGSKIDVCVKSDDTKATTQNTGTPNIFGAAQTTYSTPNLANGCFGVADEDVVDTSIGDKCVTSTAVPCEVTDSAGGAGNKATVCAPYTAPYKATNTALASPATKNVGKYTPNLTGGCFGVKDYIMADTTKNQVCGVSGSYTCQLIKNDGTRESTCVPKTVEGRGGLVGSSKANYYFPANGCWNVEDYAVIDSTYQKCLGYASKECTSSGTKKICVPPTFNGQKVAIPSGPAKAETSPDVVGGCWSVADWKAAGMWDVCAVATSIKCSLTKASVPNATFCVPKTFTAKAKKVDNTAEPFKTEGATAAEAYVSPAAGCFPSAGGAAQLLAGAAAAASVLFTLY